MTALALLGAVAVVALAALVRERWRFTDAREAREFAAAKLKSENMEKLEQRVDAVEQWRREVTMTRMHGRPGAVPFGG